MIAAEKTTKKVETKTTVQTTEVPSTQEDSKPQDPRIIKQADYIIEDSSRHNRMDKKYAGWVQLLGVGPSVSGSSGAAFGYFHTSDDIFFLELTKGSADSALASWNGYFNIDTKSVGVHWKHFTGNSFYLNTGLDFRSVDYEYSNSVTATTSEFEATSTALSFAIGNQWQWDNFTMGCDWVGVSVPLTDDISKASITTGSTFEEDEFREDQKLFSEETHIQLLRFYLGASF